jgi:ABC-2 type transport system permease protein
MNFSFKRVWAIMLRYVIVEKRNPLRMAETLYWPLMDIVLWGFTATWMEKQQLRSTRIALMIMSGLILWEIVMRSYHEISMSLMEEMWDRSFVTLFSTPLKLSEWIIGVMANGIARMLIVLFFGAGVVWLFYNLNIFMVGWMFIPFVVSLVLFGWALGFFGAAIIIYYGQKAQNIPWIIGVFFAPISGVFYPIETFPVWIQKISYTLPTVYIFEGMRSVLFQGIIPWNYLIISYILNITYLTCTLILFKYMFEKSRSYGFDRL